MIDASQDRKVRRKKQAAREESMARRQRDGQKAFYLTLDSEGKPYGMGKLAWVAEIGNLAAGLDPSCMHIIRQTYHAVTTLKSRLNDSFEYSSKLNDDYLQSMMGKAVTKKQTELISLIKKGGDQPLHIDHEVWERLVKLADSKQRRDKLEQGRYANACRRSYERTGAARLNKVRERLRKRLKRSPDQEEIELEMKRYKGFGGKARKSDVEAVKVKKDSDTLSVEANTACSESDTPRSYQSVTDEHQQRDHNHKTTYKENPTPDSQKQKQHRDVGSDDDASTRRPSSNRERSHTFNAKYVKQLEDEIQR